MIITLMGADFSASNIGTLSSWRITHSLGSGATYEGVTSVDKGAAFSATVTLTEGYEIGTAGVTVTMGGTVLSGTHSISGNIITITIASVTGNVLIKVPTININTGEEDDSLGGGSTDGFVVTYVEHSFVAKDGTFSPYNAWKRTDYVDVTNHRTLKLTASFPSGTPAAMYGYDANKQPIEMVLDGKDNKYTDGYVVTLGNDDIKYVVACGHVGQGQAFSLESVQEGVN